MRKPRQLAGHRGLEEGVLSSRNATGIIRTKSTRLRDVPRDLLEGLERVSPRQKRRLVAGWMLSDGTPDGDRFALRRAPRLWLGLDMERPGYLTVAGIVAEVERLVG